MWCRLQAVSKGEQGWCSVWMQLLGVVVLLLQDTYKSLLARYVLFTVLFTGICCILRATRGADNCNLELSIKHARARHVSNQQRLRLPRMNEKPNTQSYYVRWDLLVLLAFFLVKFAQSTAMEQDRFDARLIRPHSWSGQVRLKRQKSLLRVPECAAFLFYSFSVIHQAQFLPVQRK